MCLLLSMQRSHIIHPNPPTDAIPKGHTVNRVPTRQAINCQALLHGKQHKRYYLSIDPSSQFIAEKGRDPIYRVRSVRVAVHAPQRAISPPIAL